MNVLHITYMDSHGAGLAVLRIHHALQAAGVNSRILVAEKQSGLDDVSLVEGGVINTTHLSSNGAIRLVQRILRRAGILQTEKERLERKAGKINSDLQLTYTSPLSSFDVAEHPWIGWADIIHLHWVANFVNYPTFFKKVSKPVVWTFHDENPGLGGFHYRRDKERYYDDFRQIEDRYLRIKSEALAGKNIHLVALSREMKQYAQSAQLLNSFPVTVINNSVDTEIFVPGDKNALRKSLGIPPENRVLAFCCVQLRDPRKGLKELQAAVKELPHKDMTILCIGDASGFEPDPDLHFVLAGAIRNERLLAALLSVSDLFVMPSYQEAFAQTPLEAMACGVPVVAFPCSGTAELINAKNGIRCDSFTIDSLRKGLMEALSTKFDPSAVREDVKERFSPGKIASRYMELYESILG